MKSENKNTPSSPSCENCGVELSGQFCSSCGQEVTSNIRYFGTVILHLLDDIFSFDSRASRTLIPLFAKPGFLTQKYFQGKRVHYVPPLRLYLFISIVFFLSLKLFTTGTSPVVSVVSPEVMQKKIATKIAQLTNLPDSIAQQEAIDNLQNLNKYVGQSEHILLQNQSIKLAQLTLKQLDKEQTLTKEEEGLILEFTNNITEYNNKPKEAGKDTGFINVANQDNGTLYLDFLSKEMNQKLNAHVDKLEDKAEHAFSSDPGKLIQQTIAKLPQLMFVLLPIFACVLKIMYLFSNRLYMEHLTVALHSHSFIFLIILILEMLSELEDLVVDSTPIAANFIAALSTCLLVWVPVYLFIMQKRIYNQGYLMTTIKYFVISNVYLIMLIFTAFIALVWGLTSL